jgi:hypothetical protein
MNATRSIAGYCTRCRLVSGILFRAANVSFSALSGDNHTLVQMAGTEQAAHLLAIASTGFTLGLVHVLAGPDHLSALAALAVGTSWKAFVLGFRWGIGHSTGLVVVAVVFIALKGDLDLRALGRYCDSLVGIFMIGLGCYGVLGALKVFREKKLKRDPDWELNGRIGRGSSPGVTNGTDETLQSTERLRNIGGKSEIDDAENNIIDAAFGKVRHSTSKHMPMTGDVVAKAVSRGSDSEHSIGGLSDVCPIIPHIDMHDPTTQQIISFSIGLLHGVAGPGGILGVLPAVEMQNWRYSCVYLGSFILSSTISMGSFAALYGELTRRLGATAESVELGLSVFSAAMSIIVGTTWLVLSILGKLDSLFH